MHSCKEITWHLFVAYVRRLTTFLLYRASHGFSETATAELPVLLIRIFSEQYLLYRRFHC